MLIAHIKMVAVESLSGLAMTPCEDTKLNIRHVSVTDLEFLANYPRLIELVLHGLPKLTSLAGLEHVPQLIELWLWDIPIRTNLTVLEHVPRLTTLELDYLRSLTNPELPRLPLLTKLITDQGLISNGFTIPTKDSLTYYQRALPQAKRAR